MQQVLDQLNHLVTLYNTYVGTYAVMLLLIPAGLLFTMGLGWLQLRKIGHAFNIIRGIFDNPDDQGEISHFRALTTALSATVGTGNIVGVALAIYWGGPGAIFWMWLTGFLGMATKLVECTLAHRYRRVHADGSTSGGPMYYMEEGLRARFGRGAKVLALLFSIGTAAYAMMVGSMAQSNSVADALHTNYGLPPWITGVIVAVLVFLVIVGGIRRIGRVTSRLVPFMAFFYIAAAITILVVHFSAIPGALAMIVTDAFTGTAATGGFIGSSFLLAARFGVARGLFSNEAGQGSAAIAHSTAKTEWPFREGIVALVEPLMDTLIICTMTALVILVTDGWTSGIKGVGMTITSFTNGLAPLGLGVVGRHVVALALALFAVSTTISWSYYGDRASEYLFGVRSVIAYRLVYCFLVFVGTIWSLDLVWNVTDMFITFMTVPNVIAIVLLFPEVRRMAREYFAIEHKPYRSETQS